MWIYLVVIYFSVHTKEGAELKYRTETYSERDLAIIALHHYKLHPGSIGAKLDSTYVCK